MLAERVSNYVDSIRKEVSKKDFSLIFCILRTGRSDTYAAIKKITCCEFGITSQVKYIFWF